MIKNNGPRRKSSGGSVAVREGGRMPKPKTFLNSTFAAAPAPAPTPAPAPAKVVTNPAMKVVTNIVTTADLAVQDEMM